MRQISKKFNELITGTSESKMNKAMDQISYNAAQREQQTDAIMKDTTYVEWLVDFITEDTICMDDYVYDSSEINETDKTNVEKFDLLYNAVDVYAYYKKIYPTEDRCDRFYKVRYNENGFKVGYFLGCGNVFFVQKIAFDNKNEFIDFNEVLRFRNQHKQRVRN